MAHPEIVLASRSPERRAILEELGLKVDARPLDVDETPMENEGGSDLVRRLGEKKAAAANPNWDWVVSGDTVVECQGLILGKPVDREDAGKTLAMIRSRSLLVWTSTTVRRPDGSTTTSVDGARLQGLPWSSSQLEAYLDSGLWQNRAGSFSIFNRPCPAKLLEGRLDVVRGLHGEFVLSILEERP